MQLATHFADPVVDLLERGLVSVDVFKVPAWLETVQRARAILPAYIHFPLVVGQPEVDVFDFHHQAAVDWSEIEMLMAASDTPYLNVHLEVKTSQYPTYDPPRITERLIAGVEAAIKVFGAERVIAENTHADYGSCYPVGYDPAIIRTVIETTGCGLLLDVSHARLAADWLGIDRQAYLAQLPLQTVREIHFTGIQAVDAVWAERFAPYAWIQPYIGRALDHLPMTEADWHFTRWMLDQIQAGVWAEPWVMAYEVGGCGDGWWEMMAHHTPYADELPRLMQWIHGE